MPVDVSHLRRGSRTSTDGDVELRRARGEISCAECRRLKLKCDKKVPCSSCTRRGCAPICPNGSLATGQGARSHLADTAQLHAKIAEMGHRIGQLEEALAALQSSVSDKPHPLLQEDLLSIKSPFGNNIKLKEQEATTLPIRVDQTTAAFGTLSIGDLGQGKYFGPSAGSEALFLAGANLENSEVEDEDPPTEISVQIAQILAREGDSEGAMHILFDNLPEQPRAWALCETYLEQAAWASKPIRRDEIIEDILSPAYKALKSRDSPDSTIASFSPHKLSVLFLIFSMGALVDLTLEPCSKEAEQYYHLGRAALSLHSVFDSPEISTVQALVLMAGYHGWAGSRYTIDSSWGIMSLASKTAQSLGLHRDPDHFNLDEKTAERRRGLFWELYSSDILFSLGLGRPPSIRGTYIDCRFPKEVAPSASGTTDPSGVGYFRWKYEFVRDIMAVILERTVTAKPPTYETILDLDRRVREKHLPAHLNVFASAEEACTPFEYMGHCLLGQYRSFALLYIHRNFFTQAIQDHPQNPLRSPYAPSFLATYRCASGIIKATTNHYDRFPQLCRRWWGIWTHLFSAATIVGCVVTRSPACSMASTAYIELGLACDLYEKGFIPSRRSRSALAMLSKFKRKASEVYSQHISGDGSSDNGILSTGKPDYGDDELALFGGQTKVLVTKLLSQYRKGKPKATPNSSPSVSKSSPSSQFADVHPSLVEYLSMYPPSNHPSPPRGDTPSRTDSSSGHSNQDPFDMSSNQHNPIFGSQAAEQSSWWGQGTQHMTSPVPMATSSSNFGYTSPPPSTHCHQQPMHVDPNSNNPYGFEQQFAQGDTSQLVDMGLMSGNTGMSAQWLSFMRETGFLDSNDLSGMLPGAGSQDRQQMSFAPGSMTGPDMAGML